MPLRPTTAPKPPVLDHLEVRGGIQVASQRACAVAGLSTQDEDYPCAMQWQCGNWRRIKVSAAHG